MSRKGGYKIIDLQGYDFNSSMVIEGIHERIESSYDKPLLFTGIVIDGVEKNDVFATPSVNGDGYDVTLYDTLYHINNVDVISKEDYNNVYDEDALQGERIELFTNKKYFIRLSQSMTDKPTYFFNGCNGVSISPNSQDAIKALEFDEGSLDITFADSISSSSSVIISTFNGIFNISLVHFEV